MLNKADNYEKAVCSSKDSDGPSQYWIIYVKQFIELNRCFEFLP